MIRILFLALASVATVATPASVRAAVPRACGPDPVANVATILCAPPSGPCDAATVVVGKSLTLVGPCQFDLEGRALRIERTLQMRIDADHTSNFLGITRASDVTIGKHGRVKARGDFVRPNGVTDYGGIFEITASGAVHVAGLIDLSGAVGGDLAMDVDGPVTFARSARFRANGVDGLVDMGRQETDGGDALIVATTASIEFHGRADLRGGSAGSGGSFWLATAHDLDVSGTIDVSGGDFGGGDVDLTAGDDVRITRAKIDVRSRGGGGDGGIAGIEAGSPHPVTAATSGIVPGGTLTVDRLVIDGRGSGNDNGSAGYGALVDLTGHGHTRIAGLLIRADGAMSPNNPDGLGGGVDIASFVPDPPDPVGQPTDFDVEIEGYISARGGGDEGTGGDFNLYSAGDLDLALAIDAGGRHLGGFVTAAAAGNLTVRAPIDTAIDGTDGEGGRIQLLAGLERVGALTIASDLRGSGGRRNPVGPTIDLRGCPVTVAAGVTIDATGGAGVDQPFPPTLTFVSGRPLQLGKSSRYFAGSTGTITAYHPATQGPVIESGVRFDPALLDVLAPASSFPTCPRCGDGPGDACDPAVRIDGIGGTADRIDATVTVTSPTSLPLTGTVAVCDGSGVEDVTFAWLARSCDPVDTFELVVNDTVVADVTRDAIACDCPGAIRSHTISLAELEPLLAAGANRFGIRKSAPVSGSGCTAIEWAYATVTANGEATRVPIFDRQSPLAPFGSDPFAATNACGASCRSVDAAAAIELCRRVAETAWTSTLPCGLGLTPLDSDRDYTLLVSVSDGVVDPPVTAVAPFTRASEAALSVNGAICP